MLPESLTLGTRYELQQEIPYYHRSFFQTKWPPKRGKTIKKQGSESPRNHRRKTVPSSLPDDRRLSQDDYTLLLHLLSKSKASDDTICRIGPNRCFFIRTSAYLGYLNEIGPSNVYFSPSYFSNMINSVKYTKEEVLRCHRRLDLTSLKRIVIPAVKNKHWFCVSIEIDDRRLIQYDSYNVSLRRTFLRSLCHWLSNKSARDHGEKNRIPEDQWDLSVGYVPQQTNSFDCGPFTACVCRSLALGLPFDFKEQDMPYKRCEIALAMLRYTQEPQLSMSSATASSLRRN
eukprot:gb/GECG01014154.1/.p1 GENE.gb/GECG01014154.1/~~gb/GECG01014154.1/.p1  ORF type:complete len:287 (+),score=11.16 gb/GECG01014154.1/:1-861(+)